MAGKSSRETAALRRRRQLVGARGEGLLERRVDGVADELGNLPQLLRGDVNLLAAAWAPPSVGPQAERFEFSDRVPIATARRTRLNSISSQSQMVVARRVCCARESVGMKPMRGAVMMPWSHAFFTRSASGSFSSHFHSAWMLSAASRPHPRDPADRNLACNRAPHTSGRLPRVHGARSRRLWGSRGRGPGPGSRC